MIKDIIQKETNIDISLEPENYNSILSTFPKVFEENDVEEIEQMNKILLDQNVQTFLEKLKKPDPIMQSEFEKLLKERESQDTISSSTSETNIDTLISDINDLNERETQVQVQVQGQGQEQGQGQGQGEAALCAEEEDREPGGLLPRPDGRRVHPEPHPGRQLPDDHEGRGSYSTRC